MSCSVPRTVSLASLTLACALACGGTVRDEGNGQGGSGGIVAVFSAGGTSSAATDASVSDAAFGCAPPTIHETRLIPTTSCRFRLPPGGPGSIDPNKINVSYTPPGSMLPTVLYNVSPKEACDSKVLEWYYDDPVSPTEIDLCPDACSRIDAIKGSVYIQLACGGPPHVN